MNNNSLRQSFLSAASLVLTLFGPFYNVHAQTTGLDLHDQAVRDGRELQRKERNAIQKVQGDTDALLIGAAVLIPIIAVGGLFVFRAVKKKKPS